MDNGVKDLLCEDITKLMLSILFKQDTEESSNSTHFQTGVRRKSCSRTLKLMALEDF